MASITEAEKILKKAEKLCRKTTFHRPKWREAGDEYERASAIFIQYQNPQRAAEASYEAGRCYTSGDMPAAGGDKYEKCANLLCPRGRPCLNVKLAADAYCKAGMCYATAGNQKRCSTMLVECAKCLKSDYPDEAIDRLKEAIEIFISEDRVIYTVDVYETMLDIQLDKNNLVSSPVRSCEKCGIDSALTTLGEMENVFTQLKQPHNIRKCILAEIGLLCVQGKVSSAEEKALGVPDMRETESEAGLQLVDGAKEEDEVLWKKALRHNGMMSMFSCVFRILGEHHFDNIKKTKERKEQIHATAQGIMFSQDTSGMANASHGGRFSAGVADVDEEEEEEDENNGDDRDDSYSL